MNTYYTTLEQSKKLLELGLNPKTADMFYCYGMDVTATWDYDKEPTINGEELHMDVCDIPCWSLGALLNAMPVHIIIDEVYSWNITSGYDGVIIDYENASHDDILKVTAGKNLVEAAINMITWLLENKYIK